MENKQIIRAAVLMYANEVAKTFATANHLLENVEVFKRYSSLLENASDAEVFQEIFGFGKKGSLPTLAKDEQAVVKVLRDKISSGMKQLPALTKVSLSDPTNVGLAMEKMVDIVKDVKSASDVFEKLYGELDPQAQSELEKQLPQLMKAKMGLYGTVAFKLSELRKEAQAALQSLVSVVPSGQLSHALELAKSSYKPSLPMRGALDVLTGRDLPDASAEPMGMPGSMRMREGIEDGAKELPWPEGEPEGK